MRIHLRWLENTTRHCPNEQNDLKPAEITPKSKKIECISARFKGIFVILRGFEGILHIFGVSMVFWSFPGVFGYFGYFRCILNLLAVLRGSCLRFWCIYELFETLVNLTAKIILFRQKKKVPLKSLERPLYSQITNIIKIPPNTKKKKCQEKTTWNL